ncbi:MAG: hypothetical protein ABEL76_00625, partial [Bradymonadaceae bacterium]
MPDSIRRPVGCLLVWSILALTGCGPDSERADCSPGSCDRGVCHRASGHCVNAPECQKKRDCLSGWHCAENGTCRQNCSEGDCPRGTCNAETRRCVNREECPAGPADKPACLQGYACYHGECKPEQEVCEALDCQRGVCRPSKAKCVNAETCSDDSDCVDGYYCGEEGECRENDCSGDCDRGVCAPATGECKNAESCSSTDDCLPTHVCVQGDCRPEDRACGPEGCPGNQVCKYDPESKSADCIANPDEPCRRALDCPDSKVCREGSCKAPGACRDDAHEPNDSPSDATDYGSAVGDWDYEGAVCGSDIDHVEFEVSDEPLGTLLVQLNMRPRAVGAGPLSVALYAPDGSKLGSATTDSEGRARIEHGLGSNPAGAYRVRIEGRQVDGTVEYSLFADELPKGVGSTCSSPRQLSTGTTGADTGEGASSTLAASCGSNTAGTSENVFAFEVRERSRVTVRVSPVGDAELNVSLRSVCRSGESERACSEASRAGTSQTVDATLSAGRHYALVQPSDSGNGGAYVIRLQKRPIRCSSQDDSCVDSETARVCRDDRTGFRTVHCPEGCVPSESSCRCPLDARSGKGGVHETVDWSTLDDDYGPSGCSGASTPSSNGGDVAYRVPLGPDQGVVAKLQAARGAQPPSNTSLYVLDGCQPGSSTCKRAVDVNGTGESLTWVNDSSSSTEIYVVADASGTSGKAVVDLKLKSVSCQPGKRFCHQGNQYKCGPKGVSRTLERQCVTGNCKNGRCVDGQTCRTARPAGGGGTWTLQMNDYPRSYTGRSLSCTSHSFRGADAVFELSVSSGQRVVAKATPGKVISPVGLYVVR